MSKDAKNAVDHLFSDNGYAILKPGVTDKDLANAQAAVDKLSEGEEKASLRKILNTAKKLYEKQQKAPAIPTINDYNVETDTRITGTFEGGALKKIGLIINGQEKAIANLSTEMVKNGTFSYYTGLGQIKKDDNVQVVLYDGANKELVRKVVVVKSKEPEVSTIQTVKDFTVGTDKFVEGTFEGSQVACVVLTGNGVQKPTVNLTADMVKNGSLKYYVEPHGIKAINNVPLDCMTLKTIQWHNKMRS